MPLTFTCLELYTPNANIYIYRSFIYIPTILHKLYNKYIYTYILIYRIKVPALHISFKVRFIRPHYLVSAKNFVSPNEDERMKKHFLFRTTLNISRPCSRLDGDTKFSTQSAWEQVSLEQITVYWKEFQWCIVAKLSQMAEFLNLNGSRNITTQVFIHKNMLKWSTAIPKGVSTDHIVTIEWFLLCTQCVSKLIPSLRKITLVSVTINSPFLDLAVDPSRLLVYFAHFLSVSIFL